VVIPWLALVKDYGGSETPSRVDTGSGDRNSGQMYHKHRKPNRKWRQNRNVGVSSVAFGISSGEDCVDKHECSDDLCRESGACIVAVS